MGMGSGIRKTYSGSRIRVQGSKRHQIPDPDPQHFILEWFSTRPMKMFNGNGSTEKKINNSLNMYLMSDVLFVCSYLEVPRRYQDYEKNIKYRTT
jgi:hypothetical protein